MIWKKCKTKNGLHNFEHFSLPCTICGLYQNELYGEKKIKNPTDKEPVKGAYSSLQATAIELANKFGEPNKVGVYIGLIKRVGESRARMIAGDVLEIADRLDNPAALFFKKCKK